MFCPDCGERNPEKAAFCTECGANLKQYKTQDMADSINSPKVSQAAAEVKEGAAIAEKIPEVGEKPVVSESVAVASPTVPESNYIFCPDCGGRIPEESTFCAACGANLTRLKAGTQTASPMQTEASGYSQQSVSQNASVPMNNGQVYSQQVIRPRNNGILIPVLIVAAVAVIAIIVIAVVLGSNSSTSKGNMNFTQNGGYEQNYNNQGGYEQDYNYQGGYEQDYNYQGGYEQDYNNQGGGSYDNYTPVENHGSEKCWACYGTGQCNPCDGTGLVWGWKQKVTCSTCHGSGVCPYCTGGYVYY